MKKVLFGLVALVASSVALATGNHGGQGSVDAGAGSRSLSGTHAETSAIGGGYSTNGSDAGFAYQGSWAGAQNTTSAGASALGNSNSVELNVDFSSVGSTYSYSDGVQGGAGYGETNGLALQGGIGGARASGEVSDHDVDGHTETYRTYYHHYGRYGGHWHYGSRFVVDSSAFGEGSASASVIGAQGSVAATSNYNNGSAGAVSDGQSIGHADAGLSIDANSGSVEVQQAVNTSSVAGGGGVTSVEGNGQALAIGGGFNSADATTWGSTWTYDGGTFDEGDFEGGSGCNNGGGNGGEGCSPAQSDNANNDEP